MKHYDKKISPLEYNLQNDLGFCEGNVVKYISRYKEKGGLLDLAKAADYVHILMEKRLKEVRLENETIKRLIDYQLVTSKELIERLIYGE